MAQEVERSERVRDKPHVVVGKIKRLLCLIITQYVNEAHVYKFHALTFKSHSIPL